MAKTPVIPLAKPVFDEEMRAAALESLQNERFVLGESVFKFEEEFARYCGTKHAVSLSSGTAALQLSLIALGVKPGDQIITSPASFVASANVALHVNATPTFSDINLGSYTMDPDLIVEKMTDEVKGIIPVHLYGHPSDMKPIADIAGERGLKVVEDACQAHGAEYWGRKTGALGDVGCFSFYPSKNMTVCGDGGMITTDDEEIASKVAKLRDCGRESRYIHDLIGYTARLNTVNAAIGRVQLRRLDKWVDKRRRNASQYDRLLSDLDGLITPPRGDPKTKPVYHLYVIRTSHRDELKKWLEEGGIQCGVHYVEPIHLQPIYRELFGYREGAYPNAELLCKTCLSLPMFPDLSNDEISYISEKIHEFFEKEAI
ncbi:MAG: DegT/DnrJ/EryC1/StrS family aminotransferase [Candidatus Geothermarchaeales archaeon]